MVDVGKHVFIFFLVVADGAWILFGAGAAVQGNCQRLVFPVYYGNKKKKKKEVKLPDQPIHFTDEQTETSDTESLPVNH